MYKTFYTIYILFSGAGVSILGEIIWTKIPSGLVVENGSRCFDIHISFHFETHYTVRQRGRRDVEGRALCMHTSFYSDYPENSTESLFLRYVSQFICIEKNKERKITTYIRIYAVS